MSKISLSECMNLAGTVVEADAVLDMDTMEYMGNECVLTSKTPVHYTAECNGARKVIFKAHAQVILSVPCDRCLEPVSIPFDIDVNTVLEFDEDGKLIETEDDYDELCYINGYDLDVDGMVREEIMIGFPMKVLCDEDCKGLCPVCGTNLNKCECGCDREVLDPRMSIIRDIFRQQGSLSDDEN